MRWLIAALVLGLLSISAHAFIIGRMAGSFNPPVVCSNILDFSQACNSQYIPAVIR
jgi:hypothetical protein